MIRSPKQRSIFAALLQRTGSVFPYAFKIALPCALVTCAMKAFYLHHAYLGVEQTQQTEQFKQDIQVSGTAYARFSGLLGILIIFRTSQAYSRFWDGATVSHQMLASWWDAAASFAVFCDNSGSRKEEVQEFKELLIRMFSMLSALALADLRGADFHGRFEVEVINANGIDTASLQTLGELRCTPEIVLYWIQTVSAQAVRKKVIDMPPPIVTRSYNELAIGMNAFKDASKIASVPFPFPYSQAASLLLVVHLLITPIVMVGWTDAIATAGVFCFVQVLIFWMLHAISLELENPFGDDANDLDLGQMQKTFNRHLLVMLDPRVQRLPTLDPEATRDLSSNRRRSRTISNFVFELLEQPESPKSDRRTLASLVHRGSHRALGSLMSSGSIQELSRRGSYSASQLSNRSSTTQ